MVSKPLAPLHSTDLLLWLELEPIPNASLLAVVNTQSSQIREDGTTWNQKTLSAIARDRHGRIFNERRPLIPAAETATPPILSIHIYDPQTRMNTFLDPQNRLAWQSTLNRPPSARGAQQP